MNRLWLAPVLATAGCFLVPSPSEIDARNCMSSVTSFDSSFCAGILPTPDRLGEVESDHRQLVNACRDPTSQRRLAELDTSCIARYRTTVAQRGSEDDAIRKRYANEVQALRADPAYTSALDHWRAAHDEAEIAETEFEEQGRPFRSAYGRKVDRTTAELRAAEDRMRSVIAGHGIEPRYAEILGVW